MTYATARGFLETAKVKTRNKIHDVENVSFLAQVYLDRYGEVDDYEDIIYMDFESDMDDYHKFDDCELIIDCFADIEWSDIDVDYESDYDEEREIRLLQECE